MLRARLHWMPSKWRQQPPRLLCQTLELLGMVAQALLSRIQLEHLAAS